MSRERSITAGRCLLPPHVPSRYVDIWEHAVLLFQNFEWESAVYDFISLEPETTCLHLRAILLLNIGIVLCHLEDYKGARVAFSKACNSWTTFPLTHFLLGLANYELGLHGDAHIAFIIATRILDEANITTSLNHKPAGLNFILDLACLSENILISDYARNLINERNTTYPVLYQLPAGVIFEDPQAPLLQLACSMQADKPPIVNLNSSRTTESAPTELPSTGKWPGHARDVQYKSQHFQAGIGTPDLASADQRGRGSQDIRTSLDIRRQLQLRSLRSRTKLRHGHDMDTLAKADKAVHTAPFGSTQALRDYTLNSQPPRPRMMMARDARPEHRPLLEMSSFIRHTGPEFASAKPKRTAGPLPFLSKVRYEPRDANPRPELYRDLAAFVKSTGPDDTFDMYHKTIMSRAEPPVMSPDTEHWEGKLTEPRSFSPWTSPGQPSEGRLHSLCSSVYSRPIDCDPLQGNGRMGEADEQDNAGGPAPISWHRLESHSSRDCDKSSSPKISLVSSPVARLAATFSSTKSAASGLFRGLSNSDRRSQVHRDTLAQLEGRRTRPSEQHQDRWYGMQDR